MMRFAGPAPGSMAVCTEGGGGGAPFHWKKENRRTNGTNQNGRKIAEWRPCTPPSKGRASLCSTPAQQHLHSAGQHEECGLRRAFLHHPEVLKREHLHRAAHHTPLAKVGSDDATGHGIVFLDLVEPPTHATLGPHGRHTPV